MRPLSMLIKPASGICNMRCGYCFYFDDERHSRGIMGAGTARELVKKSFDYASGPVAFAFQGGEPTLAGWEFFENFISLVNEYNKNNLPVSYSIQTNGLLVDDLFAAFLAKNRFLVGLSLDGTREIHDKNRKDAFGAGTFDRVAAAAERLDRAGAEYNILTVLTKQICAQAEKVYAFYRSRGHRFIQFIICLDNGRGAGFVPSPAEYLKFLKTAFSLWRGDIKNGRYVSIRYFDNLVRMFLGYPPELCSMRGECSIQYVFESDGSCYPCDFFVEERYKLGNILDNSFDEMQKTDACAAFLGDGRKISPDCVCCDVYPLCRGGCRRERDKEGKNLYCRAIKPFLRDEYQNIMEIAELARRGGIS